MPEDTWESAIAGEVEESATAENEVSTDAAPPLEAQTETLETDTPQLEVESAAREGESPTEQEEVEKPDEEEGDTPEIQALPTGSQKKWARRQFHDAAPVRKYLDFQTPIKEVGDDLFQRSQSRYVELYDDFVAHDPDIASQKLFGMTAEEVKERLGTTAQIPKPSTQQPTQPQTGVEQLFTAEEIEQMPWDAPDRIKEFVERLEAKRAEESAQLKTQNEELQKRLEALENESATEKQAREQKLLETQTAEAQKIGNDLYGSAWSVVEEGIRNTGLEISKDDPPRIASLKQAARKLLSKENIEYDFDNDPIQGAENRKLVESVMLAASRGERQVAFREEDNLKVRARAAFERVKSSPEVKAILDEIESYANSRSNTKRGIPPPPVPGASAGLAVKPPTTWDEAIAS